MDEKLQRLRLLIDGMLLAARVEKNEQRKSKILESVDRLEKRLAEEKGKVSNGQELD
jgi:hypothetical protein